MGRGLSPLQKRILAYAYEAQGLYPHRRRSPWLDEWRRAPELANVVDGRLQIAPRLSPARAIFPDLEPEDWTPSQRVNVSRALARLESRGLIVRHAYHDGQARTQDISLTELGAVYHRAIEAGARADEARAELERQRAAVMADLAEKRRVEAEQMMKAFDAMRRPEKGTKP